MKESRAILAGLLTLISLTSGWCGLANAPWPMFRHDLKHTGSSPYHDAVPAQTFWKYYTGGGYSSCIIGPDNTIYLGASSYLYALNPNGTLKWRCTIGPIDRCTPAIADDGTVYIGSSNYNLYAVGSNGVIKWVFPAGKQITSSPAVAPDGTIYFGCRDGKLYAVNPDGTEKWTCQCGTDIHTTSPAVGPDGTIYVGSYDYNLYAIRPDGVEKWRFKTGKEVLSSPALSLDGKVIYFTSADQYLYAVTDTGSLVWKKQIFQQAGNTPSSPAVGANGTIYIGSTPGILYAINPDGTELWTFQTGSEMRSSPAVSADGTVYIGCWDGYLYAVNPGGTEKWHFVAKNSFYCSPAIAADGTVVINSTDGYVYGGLRGTPPTTTPPSNLVATLVSGNSVQLNWQDNSSDEYGFHIERRTPFDASFTRIATVGAGITTYVDTGLQSGIVYTYRVCAYQQGGNSSYSNEASVVTPGIAGPANLVATAVSGTRIDLSWTDRSVNELGFRIERMKGPYGGFEQVAVVGQDVTTYSDLSVNPATTYYYRVRSFNAFFQSDYSNEAWAMTPGMNFAEIKIGNTARKHIALTFDAGVTPIRQGLLDLLREREVYCTFFITGRVAEQVPGSVQQVALDGHYVGNHTYSHPLLTTCTDDEIKRQLTLCDDVLYGICGHHSRPYFRAPSGDRDARVLAVAETVGFRNVHWTFGGGDFGGWTVEQIINDALSNARNGAVGLFHASVENTELAMPTIISELRARGYKLVTVPEVVAPEVVTSPPGLINVGWNLISIPTEIANGTPQVVFRGIDIDGKLVRWDKEIRSWKWYDAYNPGLFGLISPDEGYYLYANSPITIECAGAQPTADRHIKLVQTGGGVGQWALIGYPFSTPQEWSNCRVYNANGEEPKERTFSEAIEAGWISPTLWWWDSSMQSYCTAGRPEDFPVSTQAEPWRGYWIQANGTGMELIVPVP